MSASYYIEREAKIIRIGQCLREYPDSIVRALSHAGSASDDEREAVRRELLRRTIFEIHDRRKAS